MKILFVCSRNTGRSPMAEFVMKKLVGEDKNFVIESAAANSTGGEELHEGIAAKLREENVPYTKHISRPMTAADYEKFDKIVCMDASNVEMVRKICGGDSQNKIQMLLETDIPWDKNGFAKTYEDILRGCQALINAGD